MGTPVCVSVCLFVCVCVCLYMDGWNGWSFNMQNVHRFVYADLRICLYAFVCSLSYVHAQMCLHRCDYTDLIIRINLYGFDYTDCVYTDLFYTDVFIHRTKTNVFINFIQMCLYGFLYKDIFIQTGLSRSVNTDVFVYTQVVTLNDVSKCDRGRTTDPFADQTTCRIKIKDGQITAVCYDNQRALQHNSGY